MEAPTWLRHGLPAVLATLASVGFAACSSSGGSSQRDGAASAIDAPGTSGVTSTGGTTSAVDTPGVGGATSTGGTTRVVDAPGTSGATSTGGTTIAVDASGAGGTAGGTTSAVDASGAGGTAGGGATSTGGTTNGASGTGGSGEDASVEAGNTGCTDLLYDDFLGSIVNASNWHIPTWVSPTDGTFYGQTQQRCSQNASLPAAANGNAIIALNTYNPTGGSFYGTDLITKQSFTAGVRVTVRAKMNAMPAGIVGGIFLYAPPTNASTSDHDEIDFELLTTDPANVHTNIYANAPLGYGNPTSHSYDSGFLTDYHTYEIQWLPDEVSWFVDGTIVRTVTTEGVDASVVTGNMGASSGQSPIPAGPMYLHLNTWVPDSSFTAAYNPGLHWTMSASDDQTYSMLVDWVEVTPIRCSGGNVSVDAADTGGGVVGTGGTSGGSGGASDSGGSSGQGGAAAGGSSGSGGSTGTPPPCTRQLDCGGQICDTSLCRPCTSDADCKNAFGTSVTCQISGLCGSCTSDLDCVEGGLGTACVTAEGSGNICGCRTSADCAEAYGGPECASPPFCGCGTSAECTNANWGLKCGKTYSYSPPACGCDSNADCPSAEPNCQDPPGGYCTAL
jgi:hypothetical protein